MAQPPPASHLGTDAEIWAEVRRRKGHRRIASNPGEPTAQSEQSKPEQQKLVGSSLVATLHLNGIHPLKQDEHSKRPFHRRSTSTSGCFVSNIPSRSPPPARPLSARATPRSSARSTPVRRYRNHNSL